MQVSQVKDGLQAAETAYVKQSWKSDLTIYEEVRAFDYRQFSSCSVEPILGHT